jgi:antitoxin VapB
MSLYIRDDEVDALASRLQVETGARTKTEAVRAALEHELERVKARKSFAERNAAAFALADRIGPPKPDFDQKRFADEMWGE